LALKEESKILTGYPKLQSDQRFSAGNDLVFIPDFRLSFNAGFKDKAYTEKEIAYCEQFDDAVLRYASTWAAKEAVYKAVKQLDPAVLGPKSIEIIREKNAGQPHVTIHKEAIRPKISLTISHDGDYVWAIALIETNTDAP
jgi:holo-[acyl-carrier protein] synthase